MREQLPFCDHRWRYFVHLDSRAVRARQCERCGHRVALPLARAVAPLDARAAA